MNEEIKQDVREKLEEAIKRWCNYMNLNQCIEKMIDEIDKIREKNKVLEMKGFAFQLNKENKAFYANAIFEGDEGQKVSEQNIALGRCSVKTLFEIVDLLKEYLGLEVVQDEEEELLMCEVNLLK